MFSLYDNDNNLLKSWTNIVFLAAYNSVSFENIISVAFLGSAWEEKLFFDEAGS